jgi:hypothetical protein
VVVLEARDHQRVKRATMNARNAAARTRREQGGTWSRPGLFLALPGVVSWARPREQPLSDGRHRTAYPPAYLEGRDGWRLAVRAAVAEAGWVRPPVAAELVVVAKVVAPGKLDLDRVLTAVLDALQGGEALVDDCRVWHLYAQRRRPAADEAAHVDVLLTTATAGDSIPGGGDAKKPGHKRSLLAGQ